MQTRYKRFNLGVVPWQIVYLESHIPTISSTVNTSCSSSTDKVLIKILVFKCTLWVLYFNNALCIYRCAAGWGCGARSLCRRFRGSSCASWSVSSSKRPQYRSFLSPLRPKRHRACVDCWFIVNILQRTCNCNLKILFLCTVTFCTVTVQSTNIRACKFPSWLTFTQALRKILAWDLDDHTAQYHEHDEHQFH